MSHPHITQADRDVLDDLGLVDDADQTEYLRLDKQEKCPRPVRQHRRGLAEPLTHHDDEQGVLEMTVPSSYSAPIPLDGDRVNHLKNEQNAAFGDIPVPAGATAEGDWEENVKLPGYSRSLTWASYDSSDDRFSVAIDGIQQFDGSYTRRIGIWGLLEGDGLTSSNARELAALLITAADAMDRLA